MSIAIIPARGGSKRIPRKNIKDFNGKPMIAWSIEAALASGCFDDIIVSTDDDEISEVAIQYGALAPFKRPADLANDTTGIMPVIKHALEWYDSQGHTPQHACCIYATAPMLAPSILVEAYRRMMESGSKFCFGVTDYGHPIQRALRMDPLGNISMFSPEHALTRSQDLEPAFHDAGQFCWGTREAFLDGRSPLLQGSTAILLPRYSAVDIDTLEDWKLAESLSATVSIRK